MADLLTVQQITELKQAFSAFDKDGDGRISTDDLGKTFSAIGQNVSQYKLEAMLENAGLDSSRMIDFPEFLTLAAAKLNDPEEKEFELRRVFELYDLGSTGFITVSNLRLVMQRLGCPLTGEQAYEMIKEADSDGDNRLDFEDFRRIMTNTWSS